MNFKRNKIPLILLAVFILLTIALYPQYYLVADEHHYARTAWLLAEKHTTIVDNELQSGIFQPMNGGYGSKYSIGYPLLLAPLAKLGFDWMFLVNIVLHIAAFICFTQILRAKKLSEWYGSLYLFMPFFAYYSFSLFTDYTATALVFIIYYLSAFRPNTQIAQGLLISALLFIRPISAIFIPFLYLPQALAFVKRPEFKRHKEFLITLGISLIALVIFVKLQLAQVTTGYLTSDIDSFWIFDNAFPVINFLQQLWYQASVLLIVYPFLLLALLQWTPPAWASLAYIVLFALIDYTTNVTRITGMASMVRHVRYVLPVIALLLPLYVDKLDVYVRRYNAKKYLPALAILLMLITGTLLFLQHGATSRTRAMMEDVYANTQDNSLIISNNLAYLMHDSFGNRNYLGFDDYGETDPKTGIYYPLATPGHNNSYDYIVSHINGPTYVAIVRGKYIVLRNEDNLNKILIAYNAVPVYSRTYGCDQCKGYVDSLTVELYRLTSLS